ncbi:MAG TPA: type II secretion system protein [Phycisphaerales bacterium]|nr:type II secretion system protein [Phycisphaerales bacterium]
MGKRNSSHRDRGPRRGAPAFSLVEMLVVIGIVGILVSLAVVTGTKVIAGGKARATADVIRVLDESRSAWQINWDKPLPEYLEVERGNGRFVYRPMIDARRANTPFDSAVNPSLTYYTALMLQDPMISPIFEQLDSTFVKPSAAPLPDDDDGDIESWAIRALDITDAWGRPIRYVHPAFHGGHGEYWDDRAERMESRDLLAIALPTGKGIPIRVEYRRSYRPFEPDDAARKPSWVGDADEGMCTGNTPYFYSPGDDGDPGTRQDNVYTIQPRFPVETKGFD